MTALESDLAAGMAAGTGNLPAIDLPPAATPILPALFAGYAWVDGEFGTATVDDGIIEVHSHRSGRVGLG